VYVDEVRMHYVDEGPREGQPVLMLHGEPSWSYLYRKMIPTLVGAGLRAIAPDLSGFGRSDKPASRSDYTYQRHVDWMGGFATALDLQNITLVCQDWAASLACAWQPKPRTALHASLSPTPFCRRATIRQVMDFSNGGAFRRRYQSSTPARSHR
jgi:pimeloyl-ACP methyl ester carboxylesterase